ncbi:MAG: hypothetical protein KGL39_26725 [Patescibacteria group bacterium]|nr:hypothetical protein [Patescibacteria group bacterium]
MEKTQHNVNDPIKITLYPKLGGVKLYFTMKDDGAFLGCMDVESVGPHVLRAMAERFLVWADQQAESNKGNIQTLPPNVAKAVGAALKNGAANGSVSG